MGAKRLQAAPASYGCRVLPCTEPHWWLLPSTPCREGLLLTQAPLSPSGFAFATQLPDSAGFATQLPEDGLLDLLAVPGAETAATPPPQLQQLQQQQRPRRRSQQHNRSRPGQQPQQHRQTASEEHSLQGSAGHGGDGADSGASRPRSGQSWLLSPLGALAQVFKRNANQVGGWDAGLASMQSRWKERGRRKQVKAWLTRQSLSFREFRLAFLLPAACRPSRARAAPSSRRPPPNCLATTPALQWHCTWQRLPCSPASASGQVVTCCLLCPASSCCTHLLCPPAASLRG